MFGLMLFAIVGGWICASIAIAFWIGKQLPNRPWRAAARIVLFPIVFFIPVLDEIIAWPQMWALCKEADGYEYAQGMTQEKAQGRTVYKRTWNQTDILLSRVKVSIYRGEVVDATSNELILISRAVKPVESLFAFRDAGGGRHTWLLRECPPEREESRFAKNNRLTGEILKLKFVEGQKANR